MNVVAPQRSFVRAEQVDALPPPRTASGPVLWMRENLFSGPINTVVTLVMAWVLFWTIPPIIDYLIGSAVWTGSDGSACREDTTGREVGACWAFVIDRINYFVYGSYPMELRWRPNIFFLVLAVGIVWMLWLDAPKRGIGAIYFFIVVPLLSYWLLAGFPMIGLEEVPTGLWGGILVTIVVSAVGIVVSLPFGVLLALGRRSHLPIVRLVCVIVIEFTRGVPLITVLFMANTMLPLFLAEGVTVDRLVRPLIGVAFFASAYMAEVIRGGLQAIPKGQYEGAMSLGLSYPKMMYFIILPQALRIVIPGIVNTFIGLFKDTTLVSIVGIFDLIRTVESARVDPVWSAPSVNYSGYAFAAIFYFLCCWGMSWYSQSVERRLAASEKR
ncbi:amino acid ABC transporter permease [Salinarimonas ramus]|uniref:ABC transporter membrane protein n=1 Tax=Salinarimonas ramus TaxID=690164 RepID=A0A917QKL9_9HYPH|nr:amino acid ABC transporter permease [Salinarimonas ramus]GGK54366.1 ABC transporter membrane protein [Salinarimonas ramus]